MKKKFKKNNGFTAIDIMVALVIIVMFTSLIVTIIYNINVTTTYYNRKAVALSYVIEFFERVDNLSYENTTQARLDDILNNMEISYGYNVLVESIKYNETEGNTAKKDLIKISKIIVEYTVKNNIQRIEFSRLKINEN